MTEHDVVALLRRRCEAPESQASFARAAGVSQQYVNDVLKRDKAPGEAILRALGLERVVTYRRVRR
jgi:transcriptional regulator with XRE-family HTH domain